MSAVLDPVDHASDVDKTPEEVHLYCDCTPGRDLCGRIPPADEKIVSADLSSCAICTHIAEVEGHCPYCGSYLT